MKNFTTLLIVFLVAFSKYGFSQADAGQAVELRIKEQSERAYLIDLSKLANGFYFVKFEFQDEKRLFRLIKQ